MSTKKKLLTALIVFLIAVASRVLCLWLDCIGNANSSIIVLPMVVSAVMFAAYYDKLVFFGLHFISALVHAAIWLGLDMASFALDFALDDSEEKKHGMIRLGDNMLIGLCIWAGLFVLSLFFISLKRSIKKSNEKAENERMIKEIMERNQESNFKEKNDV